MLRRYFVPCPAATGARSRTTLAPVEGGGIDSSFAIPASARRVTVAAPRLERWLAGYRGNHGELTVQLLAEPTSTHAEAVAKANADANPPDVGGPGPDETVLIDSSDGARAWLTVPFAPLIVSPGGDVLAALVTHTQRRRVVAVLLVRRGGYAVGVFDGSELIASKVGTGYVQGGTKAGGWSQKRYSRRRENQAQSVFDRAAEAAVAILIDSAASHASHRAYDAAFVGGDRRAAEAILADDRLRPIRALVREPLLAVPDPRLTVLRDTPNQFNGVRIALHP
jgi:hypothetical protein